MRTRIFFFILHGLAGVLALRGGFWLRFYFNPLPPGYEEMMRLSLPWAFWIKGMAAEASGLTRCMWRYASFRDLLPVVIGGGVGVLGLVGALNLRFETHYPNGPLLLDAWITWFLFALIRFSGRLYYGFREGALKWNVREADRVLLLGAGDGAYVALRMLAHLGKGPVRVVGLLDPDPRLVGRKLYGYPILGGPEKLEDVVRRRRISEVVVTMPDVAQTQLREWVAVLSDYGSRISTVPSLGTVENDPLHTQPLRELDVREFLGRNPVELEPTGVAEGLRGEVVLVTGGGGSIGSELCRQLLRFPLQRLVVVDDSETALFELGESLRGVSGERLRLELADVRRAGDLDAVFCRCGAGVVFHAAAYKHVPMMEASPLNAARTNVLGTRNVVEAAKRAGVKRLLYVSTDKAVEASGVMGASKAWGERIARSAGYSCVRFGNVLGSSGSVVPLFEHQWREDMCLRVTSEKATRYFMTVEEAVTLILHAESLREAGQVYVLDMGEPVRILELARQMVRLKGGGDEVDRHIQIVGLRPGEREHERLHSDSEDLGETGIPKIRRVRGLSAVEMEEALVRLEAFCGQGNEKELRKWLLKENGVGECPGMDS